MNRLQKVQGLLKNVDALLISDKINMFYLTDMDLSAGYVLVTKNSGTLFVDARYLESAKQNSLLPVQHLPKEGISSIFAHAPFNTIRSLGVIGEIITYKAFQDLQNGLPNIVLRSVENDLKLVRAIKDDSEIALMKKAATLGSKGYDYVLTLLKPGISEEEVALELEIFWKRNGSQGVAFESIIAFGSHSSMPHYRAGKTRLQSHDPVLIDIGVKIHHYHSDMTRVVFMNTPFDEMKKIYYIVLTAQQAVLELCKPGITVTELDKTARKIIADAGYGDKFVHSLGHGIGLEVHEYPLIKDNLKAPPIYLQEGMIITIEPGIYLPGIGGVRIEDTILITPGGYENLTNRDKKVLVL